MQISEEIIELLDEKYLKYNSNSFIENDPISIPHLFSKKEDIEIAGFLTATISWGNRKSIISNANQLMVYMDHAPFDFISNYSSADLKSVEKFLYNPCETSIENTMGSNRSSATVLKMKNFT
jgi:hypothetical protein